MISISFVNSKCLLGECENKNAWFVANFPIASSKVNLKNLTHEFYRCPTCVVILRLLIVFWDCHIQHGMSLLQQMQDSGKLPNLPYFLSCHPICNLSSNILIIVTNKQFLIYYMLTNFGITPIHFLHINPNILVSLFTSYMLTKNILNLRTNNLTFTSISLQILHLIVWKLPLTLKTVLPMEVLLPKNIELFNGIIVFFI